MSDYTDMAEKLRKRLDDLLERTEVIEDDLRHPLDADWSE
jgi:DnaK suppressor protein